MLGLQIHPQQILMTTKLQTLCGLCVLCVKLFFRLGPGR